MPAFWLYYYYLISNLGTWHTWNKKWDEEYSFASAAVRNMLTKLSEFLSDSQEEG